MPIRIVGRFFYLVCPYGAKWEVSFGQGGSRFLYGSREEAIQVARGAARLHWESRGDPSGVRLELPGHGVEVVASYGALLGMETPEAILCPAGR